LYPIANKSDVFNSFVQFWLLVEKHFSSPIKCLQTDNDGEYISSLFTRYLMENGIFHRRTCPHTSQQNGTSKRKHRHIVDMGLTLLAQSDLNKKFWVESFLTAVYLINRLPTPVLNNDTPLFKLYKDAPNYSFLRNFGCRCYPLLRPYAENKLSYRSLLCIFIGYCSSQKGYRCLDPTSERVYISRSVVFDENYFPAKIKIPNHSPVGVVIPPGTSSSLFQIPVPTNYLCSPPIKSTGMSSSPLPVLVSPTHQTSPQPYEPLNSYVPSISPFTQTTTVPTNHPPHPPLLESPDHLASVEHSPVHRIITRSQTGQSRPRQFLDYMTHYSSRHPLHLFHTVTIPPEPNTFRQSQIQNGVQLWNLSSKHYWKMVHGHSVHDLYLTILSVTNEFTRSNRNLMALLIVTRRG
jgi:hypothetical protein